MASHRLVSESELALQALIRLGLRKEQIVVAARRSLPTGYGSEDKVPTSQEEMTFDNYQSLIAHGDNRDQVEPLFGDTRTRTSAKLKEIGAIRNDLFIQSARSRYRMTGHLRTTETGC